MIYWTADQNGHLEDVSAEWTAVTGQQIQDALGMGWLDAVVEDDREAVEREYARAVISRRGVALTYRLRTRDGGRLPVCAGAIASFGPPESSFLGYRGSLVEIPWARSNSVANDPAYLDWEIADAIWLARCLAERNGRRATVEALEMARLTTDWGRATSGRNH